ncbi:MAG: outer membrane protein [Bradyrhizobium sp.]
MKKFLLAAAGALTMISSASAADLAARPYTKAPPPMVAALYDWSGFYLGINGGGAWSHKCWDIAPVVLGPLLPEGCHDASGAVVGGQIGYRWQASSWVFGLEAQGDWADISGSRVSQQFFLVPGDTDSRSRINSFGLFTGQIGYAWNNALFYLKGGAAVAGDRYDHRFVGTNVLIDSVRETRWGGVVGVGLEYGFTPNWSIGIEYDHMFMGERTLDFRDGAGVISTTDRIRQDVDMVTARLHYRFNWGAPVQYPVAARY